MQPNHPSTGTGSDARFERVADPFLLDLLRMLLAARERELRVENATLRAERDALRSTVAEIGAERTIAMSLASGLLDDLRRSSARMDEIQARLDPYLADVG